MVGISSHDKCGRSFSSTTAFSPPANYSGPIFFGGGLVTSTDGPTNEGFHELSVANGGGGDSIHWRVDSNGLNTHTNHVFVYFKKAQFDSPWNGPGTITSADLATAAFTMHTGQLIQAGPTDITARWVVQDGSNFYVSQNSLLIAQNNSYQTNIAAITGWAPYDPTTGLTALDFDETSTFGRRRLPMSRALAFTSSTKTARRQHKWTSIPSSWRPYQNPQASYWPVPRS